jgi:amino acid transporter
MRLLSLVAATFFMVSGGPYGLEDIIGQAGYGWTILLLLALPLLWSLPVALMVGELASAIPQDGGFYVWVTRALGPFWGFQEAWLSLAASVFDMALYPTLFTAYIGSLAPQLVVGHRGLLWQGGLVLLCVGWNLLGARDVGEGARWMCVALLLPFAVVTIAGFVHAGHPLAPVQWGRTPGGTLGAALLVAMWNTMGWDQASTIAQEVENPRRNYVRAMLGAVLLVSVCYVLPVTACALAGVSAADFRTGAWALAGGLAAGNAFGTGMGTGVALAIIAGGAVSSFAMFNSLTLSYSRLPFAMAQAGQLPRLLTRTNRFRVPWICVFGMATLWLLALGLGFARLLLMDVVLYGASLLLEFAALVVLRLREPQMQRPFRVPGGIAIATLLGVPSAALLAYAAWSCSAAMLGGYPAIAVCAAIMLAGVGFGFAARPSSTTP